MQGLTKKLLVAFLTIFLGTSFLGCNGNQTTTLETPNESILPKLSNADKVFLSSADYDLTYGDLYEEVKLNDGLNKLIDLVDSDLLSNYISQVTPEQKEAKIEELTFGTTDSDAISDLSEQQVEDYEQSFINSMTLLGMEDEEDMNEYIELVCARDLYAIEQMKDSANEDESWYVGAEEVAEWYTTNYTPELSAIKIRFMSELDAKLVLRSFNLVSKDGDLRLYTGTLPLEQVPSSQINDDNSRLLTDSETLVKFIELYNYIYSDYKTVIPTNSTLADLLEMEDLKQDYDLLTSSNSSLAKFVFETLGNYDEYVNESGETLYYTYEPVKYYGSNDTSYYLILNLDKEELVDLSDFEGTESDLVALIGQEVFDELEEEVIDANLTVSSFVTNRLVELRRENDFMIYDYYLATDYASIDSEFELDEDGNETVLASYTGHEVTADELFRYCLDLNISMYTVSALQLKEVITAHYEDVYCVAGEECEYDVQENESDKMLEHKAAYETLVTEFEESYYSSYYTLEQYLYLAYGIKSEYDMLYKYYVKSNLLPLYIYDDIISDDYAILTSLLEMAQPYYDNYFSLNVQHMLIYIDRDEDSVPDDYDEFYNGLTGELKTTFDTKLSDFETAIRTYLEDDENTMASLVSDYAKAERSDETWGEFKSFGFYILTESMGDITYKDTVGQFEQPFEDALIDLYDDYVTNHENEDYLYAEDLVQTSFGVHIIKASPALSFDKPSAKFTMTYDTEGNPEYLTGLVNAEDELTIEQLKIYADYRFVTIASGIGDLVGLYDLESPEIPATVLAAMDAYFGAIYDASYVIGYLNNTIISELSEFTYSSDTTYNPLTEAEFLANSQKIADVLITQVYDAYDHRDEE